MTAVMLIQAQPRVPATGAVKDVRLAGGGSRPYNQLGFADWRAGIAGSLRFRGGVEFDVRGPTGRSQPQSTTFRFTSADQLLPGQLADLLWTRARIIISAGDDEAAAPTYATVLKGTASAASMAGNALTVTVSDLTTDLDKPVAPNTFAGTGGIEGPTEAAGRIKRRSFGTCFNVELRLLDKVNNIYEAGDPARPLQGFALVKDKGRAAGSTLVVAWQGSIAATFAALQASAPAQGGCAVAPSIACVKWWTVPVGPLTADLQGEIGAGYVATAPAIAARIVSEFAPDIAVANLAEALGWQSAEAGVHIDQASETAAGVLDRLLLPLFLVWLVGADGTLTFRRLNWADAPIAALTAETVEREAVLSPTRTRKLGYRRNYREQSDSEVSAALVDDLIADTAIAVQTAQATADSKSKAWPAGPIEPTTPHDSDTWPDTSTAPARLKRWAASTASWTVISTLGAGAGNGAGNTTLINTLTGGPLTVQIIDTSVGTAAAIAGQAWAATNGAESAVSNVYVPVGSNAVADSGFARGLDLFTYAAGAGNGIQLSLNYPGYYGKRQVAYLHANSMPDGGYMDAASRGMWGAGGSLTNLRKYGLPVKAGDRIGMRVLYGAHRCTATPFILIFDKDGTFIQGVNGGDYPENFGGIDGDNFTPISVLTTVAPANAAYAQWMLRASTPGGANDPYLFFSEPQFAKLAAGQVTLPPYAPGPADILATEGGRFGLNVYRSSGGPLVQDVDAITSLGTAAAFAGQGALATRNNILYGSHIFDLPLAIQPQQFFPSGYLYASGIYHQSGVKNLDVYFPEDVNSNRTEIRTASAIAGQGWGATAAQSLLDNSYVAVSPNLIPNSDQPYRKVFFLRYVVGATLDPGVNNAYARLLWPTNTYTLSGQTANTATRQVTSGTSGDPSTVTDFGITVGEGSEIRVSCSPGERIIASCYAAMHRCSVKVILGFLDASGNFTGLVEGAEFTATNGPANYLSLYRRAFVVGTAPAGSVSCFPIFRKLDTYAGQADSYIWLAAPQLERAQPNQSVPSPYVPGPSSSPRDLGYLGELNADYTSGHTAAAIAGQGAFATQSSVAYGSSYLTGFGPLATQTYVRMGGPAFGIYAGILNEGGSSYITDGGYQTALGTAAAIAGQADWATYTGISTGNMATRVGKLSGSTGRVTDPRVLNTQLLLGPWNTTSLSPSYTVGGSNVTVNLPAHTRKIAGPFGPQTLNYGAVSGVVAFNAYWTAYIDDPDLTGFASPTATFTSNPDDLLYPGRYQIASGIAPASGGGGGTIGGGGGGGGPNIPDCVAAESFMPDGRRAMEVTAGDQILAVDEATWDAATMRAVESNHLANAPCVRLVSESGISVIVSESTPCTLRGGGMVPAPDALGAVLAVEDADGFRWEPIVAVEPVGQRAVAHIRCRQGTYAAGEMPDRFIFTHNPTYKN